MFPHTLLTAQLAEHLHLPESRSTRTVVADAMQVNDSCEEDLMPICVTEECCDVSEHLRVSTH